MSLSMKDVDQKTGKDILQSDRNNSKNEPKVQVSEKLTSSTGEITGILLKVDDDKSGKRNKKRETSQDRWEKSIMKYNTKTF